MKERNEWSTVVNFILVGMKGKVESAGYNTDINSNNNNNIQSPPIFFINVMMFRGFLQSVSLLMAYV